MKNKCSDEINFHIGHIDVKSPVASMDHYFMVASLFFPGNCLTVLKPAPVAAATDDDSIVDIGGDEGSGDDATNEGSGDSGCQKKRMHIIKGYQNPEKC